MKKYQLKAGLLLGCFLWVLSTATLTAQETSKTVAVKDSIPELKYKFNSEKEGGLFLKNPFKKEIIYDPILGKYLIIEKIGGIEIKRPVYMTLEEYKDYRLKKDMLLYNKEKLSALNSKKKGSADAQKNLLPKYYVNSSFFESLFGGNEIEVQPTGSVNIKMGMLYQKVDNPQLSERNRSSLTFDFDQQISASIRAKIGTRLNVNANYDTQSTFNFQNLIKLEYSPTEDDILQAVEVGNISMPIKNSLITGAQSLFGVKTRLKFGNTTITGVFAEQKSQTRSVTAQGGATLNEFELQTTDYDDNRHFFLSHYFRDNYNKALKNYPLINSPISITRVEVWVTNRNSSTIDVRNIVALADIGEFDPTNIGPATVTPNPGQVYPSNQANDIENILTETGTVRNISTVSGGLKSTFSMQQGRDFSVLENARKLLPNEYEIHPQLGFISLNRRLTDSDVLAVAFEYTISGESKVYKVGEFTSDGIVNPNNIVVKLLRSEILSTSIPMWNLMMKNVYALNAYHMNPDGFRLEVVYEDPATGVPVNILQNAVTTGVKDRTLLNLIGVDRLDQSQFDTPKGDGFFDYVEGATVNSEKGFVIFPTVAPFGDDLALILTDPNDEIYIFKELYEETKSEAKNNFQSKDKFLIIGYHKSETSNGIPLNAFNVPKGSVRVTAGGRELVEGMDYVVDYQIGRVQIIDPALEASNTPINVSVENNAVFNLQTKRFLGIDIEHKFSDNFIAGATILNLNEKPITQKSVFGQEPINNTMFGLNASYGTEVPIFTKWVNYLPNIDTDAVSNFSIRGDFAYLMPGSPKRVEQGGEATSYIDDFEGSQIPLEIKSTLQWHMASTPQYQTQFDLGGDAIDLAYGYKRARLAWYIIDPLFYGGGSLKPDGIDNDELSRAEVRRVRYEELFPEQDLDITESTIVRTLDLAYYPNERGSYNYDTNNVNAQGQFINPEDRWAGITRPLTTTNFEQSNVEYIQFWLMDPFENYSITQAEGLLAGTNPNDPTNQVGELYFNLGNISEDVLKDGRKMFENGLPENELDTNFDVTPWGRVPKKQSILYAFSDKDSERLSQDVGFDGLNDENEKIAFPAFADKEDPSSDNYMYFRSSKYDSEQASILNRYKRYNNTQGNSPTNNLSPESYPTSATTYPDTEDINKDQTMNSVESYYQYKVSLNKSDLVVGKNHIVDEKKVTVTLADGTQKEFTWYQFRIQVSAPDEVIGEISGFNSIRFMRMFLTKFKMPVVMRFGELQLVRGDWRRYTKTLRESIVPPAELGNADLQNFEVGVVNIQENENRNPIPYVLPPGIQREVLRGSTTLQEQNEQSLTIKVTELKAKETRAVYKNVRIDLRMYKKLKMFLHAEGIMGQAPIENGDLTAIIRLGSDLNDNYYQIEKKLGVSDFSATSDTDVWLEDNDVEAILERFGKLKLKRFEDGIAPNVQYPSFEDKAYDSVAGYMVRVKGNPNLAKIKTIMLGVHNNDDRFVKSGEVWFNELRIAGFDNEGGWATVVSADANFADFASVSASGRMETQGFGSIEQRVNERSKEDRKSYDVVANVNLGQLLPKRWGIQLPLNVSQSEEVSDPRFDPQYQDVLFEDAKDVNPNSNKARDYTKRRSISLLNVRKNRSPESTKKQQFYAVENMSVSYAYNETFHKDYNVEKFSDKSVRAGANYNYSFEPKVIEPFKNWSFLKKSKYFDLIKDFNLNMLPSTFAVNSNIVRSFNEQKSRDLVEIIGLSQLPTLRKRRYLFDWDYNIGYNITKSLQFNFRATNNYVYDSFKSTDDVGLFDSFFEIGRPDRYHQSLSASYKVPLDKIPVFKFIRADYAYTADFDWQSASQSYVNEIGNTIQNSNTHTFNMDMDFKKFYKIIGLTKLLNKRKPVRRNGKKGKSKAKSIGAKVGQTFYDLITSVKKARLSYSENNGTLLPGYIPEVGFLGRDNFSGSLAPSFGYVFGSQIDIRNTAIENGWLISRGVDDPYYNKTYLQTHMEKLDFSIDIKPFKNLNIELSANKLLTSRSTQQLDVIDGVLSNEAPITEFGSYSISFNMLRTSFEDNDKTFETFKSNRTIIAQRLSSESGQSVDGYGPTSQQVALPAFLAAYSGQDAAKVKTNAFRSVPIPSWQLTYKGFMKMKWFKKHFRSFSLSHSYNSLYSITNFTNNLNYNTKDPYTEKDIVGNYQNKRLYTNVNLIEEFSPLLKVSLKMKNSVSFTGQINKDKGLTLNFNNNTITQISGTEYVVGLGYRIKDVKMKVNFGGKKTNLKGDLNLRADLSLRDNVTMIRAIDEDNDQITGGQRLMSFKFFADYALTKSLTASFYFDQSTSRYAISTTFPRQSVSSGLSIRYILGN